MQYKSSNIAYSMAAAAVMMSLFSCGGHREEKRQKILGNDTPVDANDNTQSTSEKDLDKTNLNPKKTPPKIEKPKDAKIVEIELPSLEGKWQANCELTNKNPADNIQTTQKQLIKFSGDQVIFATDLFAKANCVAQELSIWVTSTYKILPSTDGGETFPAEFMLVKIELIPRSAGKVDEFTDAEPYNLKNWQLNVAKDITGLKEGDNKDPLPHAGKTLYDVISLVNAKVAFALASAGLNAKPADAAFDGSTADKRPKQPNIDILFEKL